MRVMERLPRVLVLLVLTRASTAQIVTENAGVISPELTIVRESLGLLRAENLDEVRWAHHLVFAPDRADELRLVVPLVWRDARFDGPLGEETSEQSGLGDLALRYKRALWRADDVMRSDRVSALFELGAPTGEHDESENGTPVPRQLQLGTGDWSLGFGGAWTWIRDRQRFALEGLYRHRTRNDGVQLGASADLNAAYWYRLSPAEFAGDDGPEIRGVVELLGSHTFPSEVGDDIQDDDSSILWLAPGVQVYPSSLVLLEANVQVPLLQDSDDPLGDRRWSANLVLKFLF